MRMRVVTLLAQPGPTPCREAARDVARFFARRLPDVTHEIIVADGGTTETFSAWDRALSALGPRLDEQDFIHLATPAFRTLDGCWLDSLDADILDLARRRAVAIGHIDHCEAQVRLLGRATRSWLRSASIFLPAPELRLLGPLVGVPDPRVIFSGAPEAPFRADAPLCDGCREDILDRLGGTGTAEALPAFEAAAWTMLNERMLAIRLRAQGCRILDAAWLAAHAETVGPAGRKLPAIPDWRAQVSERDGGQRSCL